MNLQIISDSQNHVGTTNHTNEFTMSLNHEIDAENNNAYIHVLNVSYPLTVKNVLEDDCWLEIKYDFKDFKSDNTTCKVSFDTGKIYLPSGVYTLDTLLRVINSHTEQYDIILSKTRQGKIGVHLTFENEYWFQQFKSIDGLNYPDKYFHTLFKALLTGYAVAFNYSPKLQYMLGLEKVDFSDDYKSYWGKNMTDIMDGVNKMFIYCDEVEASVVGDSNSKLLAIVPIELNGQGTGQLFSYSPPIIPKKLIKSKITQLHIKLCDPSNRLIPFDACTVNIECVVENA